MKRNQKSPWETRVHTDVQVIKTVQTVAEAAPKTSKAEDGGRNLVYRCMFSEATRHYAAMWRSVHR